MPIHCNITTGILQVIVTFGCYLNEYQKVDLDNDLVLLIVVRPITIQLITKTD